MQVHEESVRKCAGLCSTAQGQSGTGKARFQDGSHFPSTLYAVSLHRSPSLGLCALGRPLEPASPLTACRTEAQGFGVSKPATLTQGSTVGSDSSDVTEVSLQRGAWLHWLRRPLASRTQREGHLLQFCTQQSRNSSSSPRQAAHPPRYFQ